MKPETKEQLDDLERIAAGLNDTIENVAISGIPCELVSVWINENDQKITDKIVSNTLTKLLVNGLYSELRGMELYVTRRKEQGQVESELADEILERLEQIRKRM